MTRSHAAIAAALAASALAGCGGSSNKQLSYSGFISKADSICRAGKAATAKATSPQGAAKAGDKYVKQFKALKPPAKLKPAADEFISVSEQQEQRLEASDVNGANALNGKSDEAASKMGTQDCMS